MHVAHRGISSEVAEYPMAVAGERHNDSWDSGCWARRSAAFP